MTRSPAKPPVLIASFIEFPARTASFGLANPPSISIRLAYIPIQPASVKHRVTRRQRLLRYAHCPSAAQRVRLDGDAIGQYRGPQHGWEPIETCCANRMLRCAIIGILMYPNVHYGSCAAHGRASVQLVTMSRSEEP